MKISLELFKKVFAVSVLLGLYTFSFSQTATHSKIDLSGEWGYQFDPNNTGISNKLYNKVLNDKVTLPGTLDENKKGYKNNEQTTNHLVREYTYAGPAWYKKEVDIPQNWSGKHIELLMERTKVTTVWIDSILIGSRNNISTTQVYDLTTYLTPGTHSITILVNNTWDLVPIGGSHAYSEDTQTNWNGIIGIFRLEASNIERFTNIQVYPDYVNKQVGVAVTIVDPTLRLSTAKVSISASLWNSTQTHVVPVSTFDVTIDSTTTDTTYTYVLGNDAILWSEYNPALYKLTAVLSDNVGNALDSSQVNFGLREFNHTTKNFTINGVTTFLRGKHDACVFPLTGHPPMDTVEWIRVFKISQSYGINFYRYHTWCPPKAAFEAADMVGLYMQPELPNWKQFDEGDTTHNNYMMREGKSILQNYGNHASFVMFTLGNEMGGSTGIMKQTVDSFRLYDSRHLYAQGSNNAFWNPTQQPGDDFWTSFRSANSSTRDLRGSLSFADESGGGYINSKYPSTKMNYTASIKYASIPIMGHEVGQYQVYPNFDEMSKYTGVLKPVNYQILQNRIKGKHIYHQWPDFYKASGMLSLLCYRQDIEMALRTPKFGGFQLLDLQDFPGQGTALVGVLNAFMESKGFITPEKFREFCNDIVPLVLMDKYCWTNEDTLQAVFEIANYSALPLTGKTINWIIKDTAGIVFNSGSITSPDITEGGLTVIDTVAIPFKTIDTAKKLELTLSIEGTIYQNTYPIWVYPATTGVTVPEGIIVYNSLDDSLVNMLNHGKTVLAFPTAKEITANSVGGLFICDFWNYKMFLTICTNNKTAPSPGTLGILTNPSHPIFKSFPTEFYTNWQWWSIIKNSRPYILNNADTSYYPIVQVIDNFERNNKLGLIFEYQVGNGKLLVCTSNLPSILNYPEATQLYQSILNYMESSDFTPKDTITETDLRKVISIVPTSIDPIKEYISSLVYPNPTKNKLEISNASEFQEIVIYNSVGQQVLSVQNNSDSVEIDMSSVINGFYIVKGITRNNESKIISTIIKN